MTPYFIITFLTEIMYRVLRYFGSGWLDRIRIQAFSKPGSDQNARIPPGSRSETLCVPLDFEFAELGE